MPETYDVVVVGAGPAGLTAAKFAAAEGGKTLVLEMRARVGGQAIFESLLPTDLTQKFKGAVIAEIGEIKIGTVHEKLGVKGKIGAMVNREKLSRILAEDAVSSGAEIWINAPVRELLVKDGWVRGVRTESGGWSETVKAEVVIDATGAGGSWSSIFLRKVLGRDWQPEHMAFSNEYLMSNAEESPTEIYFTSYLAPGGRAWVYPLGGKSALAGIYGVRIHPDTALDEFLGRVAPASLAKAVPIGSSRGQIPLQGPLEQTCGNGVIAVGGAAGQICPFSGTGLRYALACGELAGKTAVDAITEGDVSKVGLSGYDSAWRSDFEAEFKACGILHSALAVAQDPKLDEILRVLKGSPPLRRAFLNLLVGTRSRSSLKTLLRNDEIADILGYGVRDKILKLV